MLCDKIRALMHRDKKINSIQVDNMENGDIYQDTTVNVIDNPAISINHIKDNPEDLKIALASISNVLLQQSTALPQGYHPVVSMKNGKAEVHSEALTEEAKIKYPQYIKGKVKVVLPIGTSFQDALNRARISQTPIDVEMIDMQKMIGEVVDPYQDQFQEEWRKSTFKIVPEELPPGMDCVIGIDNSPYRYNTVMRIRPVNPDDNIFVISNEETDSEFVLILTYHTDTKATDFTYKFNGTAWNSIYKFLNFMKAAVSGSTLYVHVIKQDQDLFRSTLEHALLYDDYDSIDYNIELVKRIITIENQFGMNFTTQQGISQDDIEMIYFVSDSINGVPMGFTWENFSLTGKLDLMTFEALCKDVNFKYKEIANITILGTTIPNITVCVNLESARVDNFDEISEYIDEQKTEQVEIRLVPGQGGNHGTRIVEI
ncbi:MAG: hypothetical protein ACI4EF_07570 [Coprococcus sp.]